MPNRIRLTRWAAGILVAYGSLQGVTAGAAVPVPEKALYDNLDAALTSKDPEQATRVVNRLLGRKYLEIGLASADREQYPEAADWFRKALALDASNHRARLELGRALYAQHDYDSARREFETVVAANPPLDVLRNIQRYLKDIESKPSNEWIWRLDYEVGAFYDDNVNVGPASTSVRIAPVSFGGSILDTLVVNGSSKPAEDAGVYGSLSVQADRGVGSRDWRVFGGASYYQSVLDDETEYELAMASAQAGLRRARARDILAVPIRYDHIARGHEGLVDVIGVYPTYLWARSDDWRWLGQGEVSHRNYNELNYLDSWHAELSGVAIRLLDQGRNSFFAGAGVFADDADDDAYSYSGPQVQTGLQRSLPLGFTFTPRLVYRLERYDDRETLAPDDRRDSQWQFIGELSHAVGRRMSAVLADQYIDNHSTFDLYEYDRNIVTLSLQGQW